MISVHEEGLWPRTGLLEDDAGGNALNLPVPRGFDDSAMAYVRDELILPAVAAFAPDAIVFLCGADGVEDDPLAHLGLSNNAHWDVLRGLMALDMPRLLVLGGGGYNPWTVGRLWTGIWGILNRHDPAGELPAEAEDLLRALTFIGNSRGRNPPEHWFKTLQDAPREGAVISPQLRQRVEVSETAAAAVWCGGISGASVGASARKLGTSATVTMDIACTMPMMLSLLPKGCLWLLCLSRRCAIFAPIQPPLRA